MADGYPPNGGATVAEMAVDIIGTHCRGCDACQSRAKAVAAALLAVLALHTQSSAVGLADGRWCPTDGDEAPCPTLRAATGRGS